MSKNNNESEIGKKIDDLFSGLENISEEDRAKFFKILDEKRENFKIQKLVDGIFEQINDFSYNGKKLFFELFDKKREALSVLLDAKREVQEFFDLFEMASDEEKDKFFKLAQEDLNNNQADRNNK